MKRLEIVVAKQSNSQRGERLLICAAAIVLMIWGIHQARSVPVLILVSGFLAVIATPPVLWFMRKRVPSIVAVLIVVTGIMAILLSVGALAGISIRDILDSASFYQSRLQQQALDRKTLLAGMGITAGEKALFEYVSLEHLNSLGDSLLARLSSVFSGTGLILLTVSLFLFEVRRFSDKLQAALGEPKAFFPKFANDIKRYVVIQTAVSLTVGILAGAWLTVLGVDFAIFLGWLAFLFNCVPNMGAVIVIVPAAILTFVQFGAEHAALAVAGYIVITFAIGNLVQPPLIGQKARALCAGHISLVDFPGVLAGPDRRDFVRSVCHGSEVWARNEPQHELDSCVACAIGFSPDQFHQSQKEGVAKEDVV